MYYKVSLNHKTVIESNAVSQNYYLKFLDAIDAFKSAHDQEAKEEVQARYAFILFEMCSHYEDLCSKMESDMKNVKNNCSASLA